MVPHFADHPDIGVDCNEVPFDGRYPAGAFEQAVLLDVVAGHADVGGHVARERQGSGGLSGCIEVVGQAAAVGHAVATAGFVAQEQPDLIAREQVLTARGLRVAPQRHLELGVAHGRPEQQADVGVVDVVGAAGVERPRSAAQVPHQVGPDATGGEPCAGVHVGVEIHGERLVLVALNLSARFETQVQIVLIVGQPDLSEVHARAAVVAGGVGPDRSNPAPVVEGSIEHDGKALAADGHGRDADQYGGKEA